MGVLKILFVCSFLVATLHNVDGKISNSSKNRQSNEFNKAGLKLSKSASNDDIIQATLKDLKDYDEEPFNKLDEDSEKQEELDKIMKKHLQEQRSLEQSITENSDDPEEVLEEKLSPKQIEMVKGGLKIPTFKLTLKKQKDGLYSAAYSSEVMTFKEGPQVLRTKLSVVLAKITQWASILVEAVMLVASIVGVAINAESTASRVVEDTTAIIREAPQFQQALGDFESAWGAASASRDKAKALFFLLKDTYGFGFLWNIFKSIFYHMTWWQWLLTAVKIGLMLVAAFASAGLALIAQITLAVISAVEFANKIKNLKTLNSIRYLK